MRRSRPENLLRVSVRRGKACFWNARDKIGVGTEAQPERALARTRHAGEIADEVEHIGDDLEMQVRGPAAVDAHLADPRESRSPRYRLALVQAVERGEAQMAVEGIEGERLVVFARDSMLQDDGRAVIERGGVVLEAVNDAIERGQHGRAGFHEEVEARMQGAPFGAVIARPPVLLARVNQAWLVVPANARTAVGRAQTLKDVAIALRKIGHVCQRSHFATADAQIEDERVAQIRFDDGSEAVPVVAQPAHYFIAARVG